MPSAPQSIRGLTFELEHCARWTIEEMRDWQPDPSRVKELQFEGFSRDFDGVFTQIFQQLEFPPTLMHRAMKLARNYDLSRASQAKLARHKHYTGADKPDRRQELTPQHIERIEELAPGLSTKLGYRSTSTLSP